MIAFLAGEPDRLEDSVSLALQRRCLAFRSREDLDLEDQCFRAHVDEDLLPARTDAWRHARESRRQRKPGGWCNFAVHDCVEGDGGITAHLGPLGWASGQSRQRSKTRDGGGVREPCPVSPDSDGAI